MAKPGVQGPFVGVDLGGTNIVAGLMDAEGRIRLDELEMGASVQAEVSSRLAKINPENLPEFTDTEGFRLDFLRIHGFEVEGVDYDADVSLS